MSVALAPEPQLLPSRLEDLTPGLLLFFDRPSLLQTWAELFGHEWRHVGITVETDDGLAIANYAFPQMFHHLPIDILSNYRRIGVARVFSSQAEVDVLGEWTKQFEDTSTSKFTLSGVLMGPLLVVARHSRGLVKLVLVSIIQWYCLLMERRHRDRPAFGCSTFSWAAVHAARTEPLRIPSLAHPDDEDTVRHQPATTKEIRVARWLTGPTDLWRAIPAWDRTDLDLCRASSHASSEHPVPEPQFGVPNPADERYIAPLEAPEWQESAHAPARQRSALVSVLTVAGWLRSVVSLAIRLALTPR